jgi:nucleoside-diphosphate-sugar epimerase
MRILLTGATGYVGHAVLESLVRAGHTVTATVRDRDKAARIAARGGRPVVADLATPEQWRDAALAQDGYVHTALEATGRAAEIDRLTIEMILDMARPSAARPRVFVYTSGIWLLGDTPQPATEESPLDPAEISAWRAPHERRVLDAAGSLLRTIVVRPGIVYGGNRGIVSDLFRHAANGLIRVVGSGDNHWPLVYDRDLGELYARLVADETASGIYHANDEGDERVNDVVEAIANHLRVRPVVRHVPIEEAKATQGAYATALALDQVVRSPRARALGWAPSRRSVSGNVPPLFEEWRAGGEGPPADGLRAGRRR